MAPPAKSKNRNCLETIESRRRQVDRERANSGGTAVIGSHLASALLRRPAAQVS